MANELLTLEQASGEIDKVIAECAPLCLQTQETFTATLRVADGVKKLRQLFLSHAGIKDTVLAMKDTRLGFLTDRSEKAVAAARNGNKPLVPYSYNEIAECCVEAMLKGYRITNNEFNIIAGNFYPAKNGKYRKIIEYPGVANFQYTTTPPQYDPDGKYAKVQGFASWAKDGVRQVLGHSDAEKGVQDTQTFKIRVNAYMGEDAVIGKAQSKLFSRVLERLTGRVEAETTDVEFGEGPVVEMPTTEDKTKEKAEALKAKLKTANEKIETKQETVFDNRPAACPKKKADCPQVKYAMKEGVGLVSTCELDGQVCGF